MVKMKKIIIITGHYGSGKTNVAINLAIEHSKKGEKTILVDMDIVNPYFRAADGKQILEQNGIKVIFPTYANTNFESPSLPSEISSIFLKDNSTIIIDVGGDDAGAVVLGSFSEKIKSFDYEMYYVISKYRLNTNDPKKTAEVLIEIEKISKLKATAIINNSNLGVATTKDDIGNSIQYANEVSELTGLELKYTTVLSSIYDSILEKEKFKPIQIYTRTLW